MRPTNKYERRNIYLNRNMDNHVRTECFKKGLTFQGFIRALITDYFIRNYRINVNTNETIQMNENVKDPNGFF